MNAQIDSPNMTVELTSDGKIHVRTKTHPEVAFLLESATTGGIVATPDTKLFVKPIQHNGNFAFLFSQ